MVLNTCSARRKGMQYVHYNLRPWLTSHSAGVRCGGPSVVFTTFQSMSFSQLLRLMGLPTDMTPPALHDHVRFGDTAAVLLVMAATGVARHIAGTAQSGPTRGEELLFYHRLAPASALSAGSRGLVNWLESKAVDGMADAPINRWLHLLCRAVLDPAVFPQLAALTAGRCLEPLYQYVLCETDGGVEVGEWESEDFKTSHRVAAYHDGYPSFYPLEARPTNAMFALQPHLPSRYLKLPTTALSPPSFSAAVHHCTSTPSSAVSPPTSKADACRLLVALAAVSMPLLYLCADYLDTNSVLLGLLPAAHSLPVVAAALSSSKYGRRVLVSRYVWCMERCWHVAR